MNNTYPLTRLSNPESSCIDYFCRPVGVWLNYNVFMLR